MALKTLNWEDAIQFAYSKIIPLIGKNLSYEDFKKSASKSIGSGGLDVDKFQKYAKVTASVAQIVAPFIKLAIGHPSPTTSTPVLSI